MPSPGMLRSVAIERTYVSEERVASIIRVTRIVELGKLAINSNGNSIFSQHALIVSYYQLAHSCRPVNGCQNFLRNVGSYKTHSA
jgi:hypothetical protein